jgi:8-oxo-dGTP pyrophosphatase MutT (NUDIX family)
METKEEILEQLNKYVEKYPEGKEEAEAVIQFVNEHEGEDLVSRKNFRGHITTSAFIIDENADALLLLKHKSLERWLQPGGHVDATDASLADSALREACEETGLDAGSLTLVSNNIFDVDSHLIPENIKKQEPGHVHHDIRFLFKCSNSNSLNISLEESTDSKWIPFSDLSDNEDFYWVREKIEGFM